MQPSDKNEKLSCNPRCPTLVSGFTSKLVEHAGAVDLDTGIGVSRVAEDDGTGLV